MPSANFLHRLLFLASPTTVGVRSSTLQMFCSPSQACLSPFHPSAWSIDVLSIGWRQQHSVAWTLLRDRYSPNSAQHMIILSSIRACFQATVVQAESPIPVRQLTPAPSSMKPSCLRMLSRLMGLATLPPPRVDLLPRATTRAAPATMDLG